MQVEITKMVYPHRLYVSSAPHYSFGWLGVVFISPTEKVAVGDETHISATNQTLITS